MQVKIDIVMQSSPSCRVSPRSAVRGVPQRPCAGSARTRPGFASGPQNPLNAGFAGHSPARCGERPQQTRGKPLCTTPDGWTPLSGCAFTPAVVGAPVVPNRALTPRFAGFAFRLRLQARHFIAFRLFVIALDARPPKRGVKARLSGLDDGRTARSPSRGREGSLAGAWARPHRSQGPLFARHGATNQRSPHTGEVSPLCGPHRPPVAWARPGASLAFGASVRPMPARGRAGRDTLSLYALRVPLPSWPLDGASPRCLARSWLAGGTR